MGSITEDEWRSEQKEDPLLRRYIQVLSQECLQENRAISKAIPKYYKLDNGILFKKDFHRPQRWRIMVQSSLRTRVLTSFQDDHGHFGVGKTFSSIRECFFFESMMPDIRRHPGLPTMPETGYTSSCQIDGDDYYGRT